MTATVADDLIKQGRLVAATRTDVARGGIGVAVRAGLPKPDISTVDALKKALLDAKSITYAKEGASGIYFAGVIQKWGLTDALKGKTLLGAGNVGELAARGEADLAVQLVPELISVKGLVTAGGQLEGVHQVPHRASRCARPQGEGSGAVKEEERMRTLLLILVVLALAVAPSRSVDAQAPIVIKVATVNPGESPRNLAAYEFARVLGEKSKGRIKVDVYINNQLARGDAVSASRSRAQCAYDRPNRDTHGRGRAPKWRGPEGPRDQGRTVPGGGPAVLAQAPPLFQPRVPLLLRGTGADAIPRESQGR